MNSLDATSRVMQQAPVSRTHRVMVFSDAASERNGVGTYYSDLVAHLLEHGQATELICPWLAAGPWDGSRLGY